MNKAFSIIHLTSKNHGTILHLKNYTSIIIKMNWKWAINDHVSRYQYQYISASLIQTVYW